MKKFVKTFGLTVAAALALAAFVGAGSASATVCSTAGTGTACAAGNGSQLVKGTKIVATVATPSVVKLTSTFVTVTCGESTVELEVGTQGSPTTTGKVTKLTFNDCHSNLNPTTNSCSANTPAETTPFEGSATTTTAPNGKLEVKAPTGTFTCNILGSNTTCRYTKNVVGNGTGGTNELKINGSDTAPTVEALAVPLEKEEVSAGSCSPTATWEGTYHVTSPTSLFMN